VVDVELCVIKILEGNYIRFYYDKDKSKELETKLYEHYSNQPRGNELHVYDVVYCPMKAYNRLTGITQKPTKQVIGYLVFGIVAQKIVQALFPKEQCEYETTIEDLIYGHIDIYEMLTYPLEVKATRKRIFKRDQVPEGWILQLMTYMATRKAEKGWIVILNVFTNQISCFCCEMTEYELNSLRVTSLFIGSKIVEAVKARNPDLLDEYLKLDECKSCMYKKCSKRQKRKK